MKLFIGLLITLSLAACNNNASTTHDEKLNDTLESKENQNVDEVIKSDSLKMIEKEKELLEKYK